MGVALKRKTKKQVDILIYKEKNAFELRDYHPSEVNWTKKKMSYDITYMQNLKYDTHELIYKMETDRLRKQTYVYQRGSVEEQIRSLGLTEDTHYYV